MATTLAVISAPFSPEASVALIASLPNNWIRTLANGLECVAGTVRDVGRKAVITAVLELRVAVSPVAIERAAGNVATGPEEVGRAVAVACTWDATPAALTAHSNVVCRAIGKDVATKTRISGCAFGADFTRPHAIQRVSCALNGVWQVVFRAARADVFKVELHIGFLEAHKLNDSQVLVRGGKELARGRRISVELRAGGARHWSRSS